MNAKIKALMKLGECEVDDIEQSEYDDMVYVVSGIGYLICTDTQADKRAADDIKELVWAFDTIFISKHMTGNKDKNIEQIETLQAHCESANDNIIKLIADMNVFISDAIDSGGRGHFLSPYDGEEIKIGKFFAYRQ